MGNSGKAWLPKYDWLPTDHGFVAWNGDIATVPSSSVPATAGRLDLVRVHLPVAASVTNVCLGLAVVGATLTSGQNFAGLWTAAGAQVGITADQTSAWGSGLGVKQMALAGGPFACTPGDYYIGFFYNGTTSPGWLRWSGLGSGYFNVGQAAPNLRFATADTGLTTTPPTNFATQTAGGTSWWAALS